MPETPTTLPLDAFRPLTLLHLVSSLNVGGMEQFVLRMAKEQEKRGHRVQVMALQGGPLVETAQDLGLSVTVLGGSQKHLRALKGISALALYRPDVINVHNPTSLHYALLGKKVGQPHIVMTRHGQEPWNPPPGVWSYLEGVIAVSEAAGCVMRSHLTEYRDRISVIQNGVEMRTPSRSREDMRAELGLAECEVVGIMVARLNRLKGHKTLLEAMKGLTDRGSSPVLLLVGDGDEEEPLKAMALSLGLSPDAVRFLGFRSDVEDLLNASDFFLLPSLTEGLPLSLLEAMALGLPSVATSVGGIPEVLRNGVEGYMVPPKDPVELANAIERLVQDADLRHQTGERALSRVKDHFSFDSMLQKYEELYYRLVVS